MATGVLLLYFAPKYLVHGSLIDRFDQEFIDIDVGGSAGDPNQNVSDVLGGERVCAS